ncbi:type III-B CRISPR-associated protein Cas10/Cmr2 [Marichromatium bheemlicum]|uniref:Type III-B CRISPR-associated protein Cas10/Cmr2 n=2 Tax=Marichromatium bheemlicum TaxID=365339 RepID=A0ABX1IAU2_9GAMM|nr:type III-B CRISPR-associated protein Cas10/Cmr2 [Marichromatium bheemlicum]
MKDYLITLSIGPVQGLIASARRTRDLWCGSWLLSEVSKAAALTLHRTQPGCLVFPCLNEPETKLAPDDNPGDTANVANILRAELALADDAAARALCAEAAEAARVRLREIGEQVRQDKGMARWLRDESLWSSQFDDLLEIFSAWVEIDPEQGAKAASERLGSVLAARKATRDFAPLTPPEGAGLPKSSLDGVLETVLQKGVHGDVRAARRLGLASANEQLDALGVIKRLAGDPEQFTPYSRIAADPWLRSLDEATRARLGAAYEPLIKKQIATRVKGNGETYRNFPYDAQLLFAFRLDNQIEQLRAEARRQRSDEQLRADQGALDELRRTLESVTRRHGTPVPYAAILKADGDRMGKLLDAARSTEDSRMISHELHKFASGVAGIVRDYQGHAIYAGGDDVLALVPRDRAVDCAKALAVAFEQAMAPCARALASDDATRRAEISPTLSVGIGIGHLMEPLGALRQRADAAEKLAKDGMPGSSEERNALAIQLGIRSGGELRWRARWDEPDKLDMLDELVKKHYHDSALTTRVAYDLRNSARRLSWLDDQPDAALRKGMRRAELLRVLDRTRTEQGQLASSVSKALERHACALGWNLGLFADTLIIARWLSARTAAEVNP